MGTLVPRAAVSIAVRLQMGDITRYALVQRANEPHKGLWSLPGGKIQLGEGTIQAARRELWEETGLRTINAIDRKECRENYDLRWYEGGPFTCSDSIHYHDGIPDGQVNLSRIRYHYIIAQCFAEINGENLINPPELLAADDALDAKWLTLQEIHEGVKKGSLTKNVGDVYSRAEALYQAGLFNGNK